MGKSKNLESIKGVNLNWVFPSDLKSYFSDNFIVQHQKDHFVLSFFEVIQPAILGTLEERKAQVQKIKQVDAKCIARILVTPEKMKDIVNVMNENYNNYLKIE